MPEEPGQRPVVEYAAPAGRPTRQLVTGHLLGAGAALGLVIGSAILGSYIDAERNEGKELAGLAGLVAGGLVGLAMVLPSAAAAVFIGRRRGSAILRGTGQGMLVSLGVAVLAFGLCAVV